MPEPKPQRVRAGAHRAQRRSKPVAVAVSALITALIGIVAMGMISPPGEPLAAHETDGDDSALEQAFIEPVRVQADAREPARPQLPAKSGRGKRIVYDQKTQRVWLVGSGGKIKRTYPVSGSKLDNVKPGNYQVQAKFDEVLAYDGSGTMNYFVQFTRGDTAAIGFHDLPRDRSGDLKQKRGDLGERRSDGCVRQWKADAKALWKFASVGTDVVVTS